MIRPRRLASKAAKSRIHIQYADPFHTRQYGDIFLDEGRKFNNELDDEEYESSGDGLENIERDFIELDSDNSVEDRYDAQPSTPKLMPSLKIPKRDIRLRNTRSCTPELFPSSLESTRSSFEYDKISSDKTKYWESAFNRINQRWKSTSFHQVLNIAKRRLFTGTKQYSKRKVIKITRDRSKPYRESKIVKKWNRIVARKTEPVGQKSRGNRRRLEDFIINAPPVPKISSCMVDKSRVTRIKKSNKKTSKPKKINNDSAEEKYLELVSLLSSLNSYVGRLLTSTTFIHNGFLEGKYFRRIHMLDSKFDEFISFQNKTNRNYIMHDIHSNKIVEWLQVLNSLQYPCNDLDIPINDVQNEFVKLIILQYSGNTNQAVMLKHLKDTVLRLPWDDEILNRLGTYFSLLSSYDINVIIEEFNSLQKNFTLKVRSFVGLFILSRDNAVLRALLKVLKSEWHQLPTSCSKRISNILNEISLKAADLTSTCLILEINIEMQNLSNSLKACKDFYNDILVEENFNLCNLLIARLLDKNRNTGSVTKINFKKSFSKILEVFRNAKCKTTALLLLCNIGKFAPVSFYDDFSFYVEQIIKSNNSKEQKEQRDMFLVKFCNLYSVKYFPITEEKEKIEILTRVMLGPLQFLRSEYNLTLLEIIASDDCLISLIDPAKVFVKDFLCILKVSNPSTSFDLKIKLHILELVDCLSLVKKFQLKEFVFEFLLDLVRFIASSDFVEGKLYLAIIRFICKHASPTMKSLSTKFGAFSPWTKDLEHEMFRLGSLIYETKMANFELRDGLKLWLERLVDRLLVENRDFKISFLELTRIISLRVKFPVDLRIQFDNILRDASTESGVSVFYDLCKLMVLYLKMEKYNGLIENAVRSLLISWRESLSKSWLKRYLERTFELLEYFFTEHAEILSVYALERHIRLYCKVEQQMKSSAYSEKLFILWWSLLMTRRLNDICLLRNVYQWFKCYLEIGALPFFSGLFIVIINEHERKKFQWLSNVLLDVLKKINLDDYSIFIGIIDFLIEALPSSQISYKDRLGNILEIFTSYLQLEALKNITDRDSILCRTGYWNLIIKSLTEITTRLYYLNLPPSSVYNNLETIFHVTKLLLDSIEVGEGSVILEGRDLSDAQRDAIEESLLFELSQLEIQLDVENSSFLQDMTSKAKRYTSKVSELLSQIRQLQSLLASGNYEIKRKMELYFHPELCRSFYINW